ncbi:MAG: tetraacyldisaccharide 4'-kinase [Pirellulales bacterium]|nr:tetraacyldisaccharide 4'-kinase [Pirellulales bacterium]
MLSPSEFRDLVSGRRRGIPAAMMRLGLRLAETPYSLAVRWRNRRYDTGKAEIHRVAVPVVSIGNLTLGGTGKTPMVEWVARWYRRCGVRVTAISRGYGAEAGSVNDEALELEQKLPDVPHLQNPDRVAAAELAIEELDCQLIVLDDAFQHRRIARDLDIVLLDALEPFGYGHVFPRGTLREPKSGLRRADVVVLSRADMLEPSDRRAIQNEVRRDAADVLWAEAVHKPRTLVSAAGEERPVDLLRDQPVAAFCGLGNPAGFRHTLQSCGYRVIAAREFADHYRYGRDDVESLAQWADSLDVAAVLCSHKDLVKLDLTRLGSRPLWAITIGLEMLSGQVALEARLDSLLPRP